MKAKFDARMLRLKARTEERKIKNFWSDESEESEEELPVDLAKREVDLDEFQYVKAQRKKAKLAITKWVRKWRDENNGENPTDENT